MNIPAIYVVVVTSYDESYVFKELFKSSESAVFQMIEMSRNGDIDTDYTVVKYCQAGMKILNCVRGVNEV